MYSLTLEESLSELMFFDKCNDGANLNRPGGQYDRSETLATALLRGLMPYYPTPAPYTNYTFHEY